MASVSSLDKDLSRMRMAKYTAKESSEVKDWISEVLGISLPDNKDLMEVLKDGVILCRLSNLVPGTPTLKPKASSMPFVQMEQIAAFVNIASKPPIGLPPHDVFLTVDLFEQKDPAQVVQCLTAFSRVANRLAPELFPTMIGGKKAGLLSPNLNAGFSGAGTGRRDLSSTGSAASTVSGYSSNSNKSVNSAPASASAVVTSPMFPTSAPTPAVAYKESLRKSPPPAVPAKLASSNVAVSSWTKKDDEKKFAPAWNIHQYGYMGGASQGNMGVSFGGRRQITNAAPEVPSLKKKEDAAAAAAARRKEDEGDILARADALRRQEEAARLEKSRAESLRQEEASRQEKSRAESLRQEEASRLERSRAESLRQEELSRHERSRAESLRLKASEEEKKRQEEELRWRRLEEEEAKERARETLRQSQMQAEQGNRRTWQDEQNARREREFAETAEQKRQRDILAQRKLDQEKADRERERARVRELEMELAQAREREKMYQAEKEERRRQATSSTSTVSSVADSERSFLKKAWNDTNTSSPTTSIASTSTLLSIKSHKTGGPAPTLAPKKSFPPIATHRTGGTIGLTPQKTGDGPRRGASGGGLVAQRTGQFNQFPSPSLKTLTPGEYASSGRISPSPITPNRTGERTFITSSHTTTTTTSRPLPPSPPPPPPRALPSPPGTKKFSPVSPPRLPASRYFTAQRTGSGGAFSNLNSPSTYNNHNHNTNHNILHHSQSSQVLRRQNSWDHDNETVIDVPTNASGVGLAGGRTLQQREEDDAKERAYRWANMSFLEKERERERERQREWEKAQMEKQGGGGIGGYRSQVLGPRSPRS
ncbi:hypothetical protein DFH27DRAFT_649060 [Peziza echinospora]|nr:hypothetical protein DFH27DRAFT_649060 [Peziza echinospora]